MRRTAPGMMSRTWCTTSGIHRDRCNAQRGWIRRWSTRFHGCPVRGRVAVRFGTIDLPPSEFPDHPVSRAMAHRGAAPCRRSRKRRRHCEEGCRAGQLGASVHNTQPWRFVVRPDVLELHAENDRPLSALDTTGRQMVISCGCVLFNARVGLAADRVVRLDRLPDPANPICLPSSPCAGCRC
jgi:hypothetical protein